LLAAAGDAGMTVPYARSRLGILTRLIMRRGARGGPRGGSAFSFGSFVWRRRGILESGLTCSNIAAAP